MPAQLIVWGSAIEQVRTGSGDERSAAMEAFGSYCPKEMTFMEVLMKTMHSDRKRRNAIAELLSRHVERFPEFRPKTVQYLQSIGLELLKGEKE